MPNDSLLFIPLQVPRTANNLQSVHTLPSAHYRLQYDLITLEEGTFRTVLLCTLVYVYCNFTVHQLGSVGSKRSAFVTEANCIHTVLEHHSNLLEAFHSLSASAHFWLGFQQLSPGRNK